MNSWLTYVGGKYTPEKFLKEAARVGSTRRVSRQQVQSMAFGDQVIFCYLPKKGKDRTPVAFATMRIASIVLGGVLGELVINALEATEWAERVSGDPVHIERECGSYTLSSAARATCSLEHVVETAQYIAEATNMEEWYMIGGHPIAFEEPVTIEAEWATRQMRGFVLCPVEAEGADVDPHVLLVTNYQQN